MVKSLFILGTLGMTLALSSCTAETKKTSKEKTNVIIILTDDQGYGDFSCHGNPVLKTPALDQLHHESIRFHDFHVAPQCTPTRGQLITGCDALRNKAMTVLAARNIMRRDLVTMPEIFRQNGYATGIFGKWHLGNHYPDRPMDRGFQKCIWHTGWGLFSAGEFDNDYYETRYLDSLEIVYSGKYCTNLWFDKAMEWMDEMVVRGQPFFTFLSLNAPHGPYHSPAQDFNYYKDLIGHTSAASFFGMIRNIDRNMAHLEDWLNRKEMKANTLLVFITDNGGTGGVQVYNAGMKGRKESNYEGGHRAACFMRWPGGNFVTPFTDSTPTQIQDLLPTFINLLDLKCSADHEFDGRSLQPILEKGEKLDDRMFVVQFGPDARPEIYYSCVIWNSWRLVGKDELYDIKKDPGQENNLAKEYPEVMDSMKAFYDKWWRQVEPGIDQFVPVIVGSENENPVILDSHNWVEGAVNGQRGIARALGPSKGGNIHIHVAQEGRYRIELSRWPFHMNRGLRTIGPGMTIGGTQIETGKALPVEFGCLSIDGKEPLISKRRDSKTAITMEIELSAGRKTIRAWFKDLNKKDLCGAYYVKMLRL